MNVLSRCIIIITSLLVGMFSEFFKIKIFIARLYCSANKPSFKEDIDKRKCNLTMIALSNNIKVLNMC